MNKAEISQVDKSLQIFFSIKLSNLQYTSKRRAYSIEIKNMYIYKEVTTHALNLMNQKS